MFWKKVQILRADKDKKFLINFMIKQVMTKDMLSQLSVGSLRVPVYMLIICESFSMACFGGDFLHFDWT